MELRQLLLLFSIVLLVLAGHDVRRGEGVRRLVFVIYQLF